MNDIDFPKITISNGEVVRETRRQCGSCTLCCRLLPVRELGKLANQRCQHQRLTGCRVYHEPAKGFPLCCGLWSCRWLNGDAHEVGRPDRVHYVIDCLPDKVIQQLDDGREIEWSALQIWVDPMFRDAWKDPALAAYIDRKRMPALMRYSSSDADMLWPPSLMPNKEWFLVPSNLQKLV